MVGGATPGRTRGSVMTVARFDTVSLLTDFGTTDEFVGVMKSVIRDLAAHVTCIDLTHGVAPFDVRGGSLALARSIAYLPAGVIVAVVDPGVGTPRRPIAVEVADGDGVLIGPDNGLLAPAVAMAGGAQRVVELAQTDFQLAAPGATFAGRDIFAPAAAHLCNGVDLAELGPPIDAASLLPGMVPLPREDNGVLVTEVLWTDRFGNCQLNAGPDDLPVGWGQHIQIEFAAQSLGGEPIVRSTRRVGAFGNLRPGEVGLLLDSYGMLTVTLNQRSATEELGLRTGSAVTLRPLDAPPNDPTAAPTTVTVTIGDRPDESDLWR